MSSTSITEQVFAEFVQHYGGELVSTLLPANPASNADYLFRKHNVIAELKCLQTETHSPEYKQKIQSLAESWMKRRLVIVIGTNQLQLNRLPVECQREWMRVLETPIQKNVIGAANKQIRETKQQLNLPDAKGLLLVASDGNDSLQPNDVWVLLKRILSKRGEDGSLQYSNIHAIAYFSVTMPVLLKDGIPSIFWMGGARNSADKAIQEFDEAIEAGWYAYLSQRYGKLPKYEFETNTVRDMKFISKAKK